eukprot:snap_masked-scaffold_73-processed-gene-0.30-mRNA-1 protein AED:1.00 eAED:1.00 QI:0/0/0/0/1/1/2/0/120
MWEATTSLIVSTFLKFFFALALRSSLFTFPNKRCKFFAPRESDKFKDIVEEVVLEINKVKSLGGGSPVTQVLKKSKLDFSLLFEDGDSSRLARNIEPSRGELLRYLDVDGVAGSVDILAW